MKLSAPNEQSSSDPIKSFVQLEFYNGVNLIQSIHKSMASLVKVIRGTQLLDEKVAQLADSLMKQETPSRWQKIWDGPEDPMLYIKVVVEKTNAVQSWNSAVEKGKLLKGRHFICIFKLAVCLPDERSFLEPRFVLLLFCNPGSFSFFFRFFFGSFWFLLVSLGLCMNF